MAQKPLFKSGKKQKSKPKAANKHGKGLKVQKGKLQKAPKSAGAIRANNDQQEVSKLINKRIEEQTAAAAVHNGLRLSVVKPEITIEAKTKKPKGLK